jgi:hypothetical protein
VNGVICRFTHLKVCRKFRLYGSHSRHGCKLGAKCSKLHPKLCEGSQRRIKERQCLNPDCPHLHLKGTRRKEDNPERKERQDIVGKTRNPNTHTNDHSERVQDEHLPFGSPPLRPGSQQNPGHLQSGFLSIVLKEVRNAREESLRQADRMEEILSQLGPTHNESILHNQLAHHLPAHPPVQYTLPTGTLTQGVHRQLLTQTLPSQRLSF